MVFMLLGDTWSEFVLKLQVGATRPRLSAKFKSWYRVLNMLGSDLVR